MIKTLLFIDGKRTIYIPDGVRVKIAHIAAPESTVLQFQHTLNTEFSDLFVLARIGFAGV